MSVVMEDFQKHKKEFLKDKAARAEYGLPHGLHRLSTLKKIAKALDAELVITMKAKKTA